ncbi:MAG: hypothetical protein V2A79_02445 [Planctomycetota bacterium]
MAALFRIEIGESVSCETLRTQAVVQLTNISISAEMDRAEADSRTERADECPYDAERDGPQRHNPLPPEETSCPFSGLREGVYKYH